MLSLAEELFLLAIDEEKGAIIKLAKRSLNYALVGAIIADLALQNRITINDKGRLELVDTTGTGDPALDFVLQKVQSSEKPRRLSSWISEITKKSKKLRQIIEDTLIEKGFINREDDRFLGISQVDTGESKFSMKYPIKTNLRAGILAGQTIDLHSLAMLGIARSSMLLYLVFTADEQRLARKRIQETVVREALDNPMAQIIEEIDAAVAACLADA
jgi:Golgi phosphoprotein 3